jgi:hypothetical protein
MFVFSTLKGLLKPSRCQRHLRFCSPGNGHVRRQGVMGFSFTTFVGLPFAIWSVQESLKV